jgi:hypothetical protein
MNNQKRTETRTEFFLLNLIVVILVFFGVQRIDTIELNVWGAIVMYLTLFWFKPVILYVATHTRYNTNVKQFG